MWFCWILGGELVIKKERKSSEKGEEKIVIWERGGGFVRTKERLKVYRECDSVVFKMFFYLNIYIIIIFLFIKNYF